MPLRVTSTYTQPDGSKLVLDRDCCPICGTAFEVVTESNTCNYGVNRRGQPHGPFSPDELITEEDDYAWCL